MTCVKCAELETQRNDLIRENVALKTWLSRHADISTAYLGEPAAKPKPQITLATKEPGISIQKKMLNLGLNYEQVGEKAHLSGNHVNAIVLGRREMNEKAAALIGMALGVDLMQYAVKQTKAIRRMVAAPQAPHLPGVVVPVAPGVSLAMGEQQGAA